MNRRAEWILDVSFEQILASISEVAVPCEQRMLRRRLQTAVFQCAGHRSNWADHLVEALAAALLVQAQVVAAASTALLLLVARHHLHPQNRLVVAVDVYGVEHHFGVVLHEALLRRCTRGCRHRYHRMDFHPVTKITVGVDTAKKYGVG